LSPRDYLHLNAQDSTRTRLLHSYVLGCRRPMRPTGEKCYVFEWIKRRGVVSRSRRFTRREMVCGRFLRSPQRFSMPHGWRQSYGTGIPISISRKQKLNTKSNTEAELVGVDDVSTLILWTKLFLDAQAYRISRYVLKKVQSYWRPTDDDIEQGCAQ
jgi:hypothetical protein